MKKPLPEKTLDKILGQQHPQSILGFIQKKVVQLQELNHIWQQAFPDLAQHSRIANFREGCLVIEVDNGAWATRLRYLIPDLTRKLARHRTLEGLTRIEWYIQPSAQTTATQTRIAPPVLSDYNAQLLKNTALTVRMKQLQEALIRLAKNNSTT